MKSNKSLKSVYVTFYKKQSFIGELSKKYENNECNNICANNIATDVLLCHDDELEGRRIAFILYLTEGDWDQQWGGSLDLFSVDGLVYINRNLYLIQVFCKFIFRL